MTEVRCAICGHKVEPPEYTCARCAQIGQRRLKSARIIAPEPSREWVDPTVRR